MRFWQEIIKTVKLSVPIVLGQAIPVLMHLVDAVMIGRLGVTALSANGFGTHLVSFFLVCGIGLCSSVHVHVAQAHGKGDEHAALASLKHGLWISSLYGLFWSVAIGFIYQWSDSLGQPPEVVEEARSYILLLTWSAIPVYAFQCLKNYYEARKQPWLPFWIRAGGVLLNVLLNWLLIFGNWGCPAMGVAGAGWATLLSRIVMLLVLAIWFLKFSDLKIDLRFGHFFSLQGSEISRALKIGFPSAVQAFFSMGMYSVAGLMFGWLGNETIAANNIAMRYANFTIMIPLGMSYAATVQVGSAFGAKDFARARTLGWICIGLCTVVMVLSAGLTFGLREWIPLLFTDDETVIGIAAAFFMVTAWIQIVDALQFGALGALRGLGDVKVPAWIAFGGYWLVSLSLAYVFAFRLGGGGMGLWFGLLLGLILTAVVLCLRFFFIAIRQLDSDP